MSPFDISSFVNEETSGEMSYERPLCPEGQWEFVIPTEIDWNRAINERDRDDGSTFMVASILLECISPEAKKLAKRGEQSKLLVPYDMFLDFNSNGKLSTAEGDNVALGQLRRAAGINSGSFSWNMLLGRGPFQGTVKHQKDKNSDQIRHKVVRVAPREGNA